MKRLLVLLIVCVMGPVWAQTPAQSRPRAFTFGPGVRSPEVAADGSVTFRYRAPNAKAVILMRDGAPPVTIKMDEKGVWTATTDPLLPDFYPYSFIVDGSMVPDPANPMTKSIYKIALGQSLVHVPGPRSLSWEVF